MAERFLYIPSVGFSIAAALVLESAGRIPWLSGVRSPRAMPAVILCLIALLAVRTADRNRDWLNELRFFGKMSREKPGLAGARLNYGTALMKAGGYDEALTEYEAVARRRPELTYVQENLMLLREMNRTGGGPAMGGAP